MGVTNFDQLDAKVGRITISATLPSTPNDYYGVDFGILTTEWRGGEVVYYSVDNRIYVQQATSGRTPSWKRLAAAFATSTTSSSTSSTSSSSSTTSSSSSTSTSTSTSSSTSSSSSSSSSTTTP